MDHLPDDMGTNAQHILITAAKARATLGWTGTDSDQALAASVAWHLAHPPDGPDPGFEADDLALAAVEAKL